MDDSSIKTRTKNQTYDLEGGFEKILKTKKT
jgi:hypothetical protein